MLRLHIANPLSPTAINSPGREKGRGTRSQFVIRLAVSSFSPRQRGQIRRDGAEGWGPLPPLTSDTGDTCNCFQSCRRGFTGNKPIRSADLGSARKNNTRIVHAALQIVIQGQFAGESPGKKSEEVAYHYKIPRIAGRACMDCDQLRPATNRRTVLRSWTLVTSSQACDARGKTAVDGRTEPSICLTATTTV